MRDLALQIRTLSLASPDRCYGFADNGPSVAVNAEVAIALRPYTFDGSVNSALQSAVACLEAAQGPDGSFGSAAETAQAVLALLQSPGFHEPAIARGRGFLITSQRPDGSWDGSVRATALAIRALAVTAPDWRITCDESGVALLRVPDSQPLFGDALTAFVKVENLSGNAAPAVPVNLYARPATGGAEALLATVTLPALAAGASATATLTVPSIQMPGRLRLRAAVDPDGQVAELDETNNEAIRHINVRTGSDLAITTGDIQFRSVGSGQTEVEVTAHNRGAALPVAAMINIYAGNPATGGIAIGSGPIAAGLGVNQQASLRVIWNSSTANGPTPVYARLDEANVVREADESNNEAFRFYVPGADQAVELEPASASFSPGPIRKGQPFTLNVVLFNRASVEATRVPIAVFEGPDLRAQTEVARVPAKDSGNNPGKVTVALGPLVTETSTSYLVVVDPQGLLNESDRANNRLVVTASVTAGGPYELRMVSLASNDSVAPFTVTATVQQDGTSTVSTFIRLRNELDGSVWAHPAVTLLPGVAGRASVVFGPFSPPGDVALTACVDPENALEELNEQDNCASLTVSPGRSTDLAIAPRDISISPVGVDVGEPLSVSATIRNRTPTPESTTARLWRSHPRSPTALNLGEQRIDVPGNGHVVVSWDVVRPDGDSNLWVSLDDVVPRDVLIDPPNGQRQVPGLNLASRNIFLKAFVSTKRPVFASPTGASEPVIGDLLGTGHPVIVLTENSDFTGGSQEARVTALQVFSDGSSAEVWSRLLLQGRERTATQSGIRVLARAPLLVDLEGDGQPEVVVETTQQETRLDGTRGDVFVSVFVLDASGNIKAPWPAGWNVRAGPLTFMCHEGHYTTGPTVGDVNGDGIVDVVLVERDIVALDGRNGSELFRVEGFTACSEQGTIVVLDVDGDGRTEVLLSRENDGIGFALMLIDGTGAVRWRVAPWGGSAFAVVDVDLDGAPEIVAALGRDRVEVRDARTGARKSSVPFDGWNLSIAAGGVRQDGLPYSVVSAIGNATAAFGPGPLQAWQTEYPGTLGGGNPLSIVLADLLDQGRPQVVAQTTGNYARAFGLQDARDGRLLLHTGVSGALTERRNPRVADLDTDDRGDVLVEYWDRIGGIDEFEPVYPPETFLVFSSVHWKKMPPTWNHRTYIRGQVDDKLQFKHDYQWWKTHNTWMQQFDVEPVKLLPDVAVLAGDVTSSPAPVVAGGIATLRATVRNVGGISASNVRVAFYDGNPQSDGKLLGETVVAGPLSPRTGVATAMLGWAPYPEGNHDIYAVANSDGALEESSPDNNTGVYRAFVAAGTGTPLCDLAIIPSSLSAAPLAPQAGATVVLSATLRNEGGLPCGGSTLNLYERPAIGRWDASRNGSNSITRAGRPGDRLGADRRDPGYASDSLHRRRGPPRARRRQE
ncbi:MAG TPA: CARDB domain-containing protein [Vicinamibacterales bacterium]